MSLEGLVLLLLHLYDDVPRLLPGLVVALPIEHLHMGTEGRSGGDVMPVILMVMGVL